MTRETFQEVGYYFQKSGKCAVCGKRMKRRKHFYQTYNPWNRHPDGRVKTPQEIANEVVAKGRAWEKEPMSHDNCSPTPGAQR